MEKKLYGGKVMKITVLERVPFSAEQKKRLSDLVSERGEVEYFEYREDIAQDIAIKKVQDSDVVVVNWIDPSPFILSMRSHSLIALLSTGYGWIQNLQEAREKNILVSNIPAYSTEAVAEHVFGLLLAYNKKIMLSSNWTKSSVFEESNKSLIVGTELKGKTLGIIGLGNIGSRIAELATAFGMNIITYNRTRKNNLLATDVILEELLSKSDIICISCSLNNQSKGLINSSNIKYIKHGMVLIGATWGVVDETVLEDALKLGQISGVAFDLALEGAEKLNNRELLERKDFLCTFHNAYNTVESEKRQLDICIDNIEAFLKGNAKNIIN